MIKLLAVAFAAATFGAGLAVTPPPSPAPTPAPVPTASQPATPLPSPTGSPLPSASPSPSVSPSSTPAASPAPLPTPLALPPDAPPQILAIQTSENVLHAGDKFSGTVITSTNVAAVEIRLAGHARRLARGDAGIWQIAYVVPQVPFWMRRTYTADVVAINTAGEEASRPISISLR